MNRSDKSKGGRAGHSGIVCCRECRAWASPSRGPQVDRRRRRLSTAQNGTTAYTYNDSGALLSEEYTGGTLAGMNIQYTLDSLLRRASVSARNGTTALATTSYTYDNASRLSSVGDGTYSAGYAYLANLPMVSQISFKQNTTTRMTSIRHYVFLNRLGSISFVPNSQLLSPISYSYTYNAANQLTRVTLGDLSSGQANGSYWLYEYDTLGQVRSGKRYWDDHTPVPGQRFEYGFDDIGNRAATQTGGDSEGAGLRVSTYNANLLNQFSQRTIPASFDVLGVANAAQTVTVNGSATDYRRGEYFQESVAVGNSATAVWQGVSVTTSGGGSGSGAVFVPKTPEVFTHDLDGNTLADGRWNYTWDAENRLVTLVGHTGLGAPLRLDFEYDAQGRRIRKRVWNNTAGTGSPTLERKYIYDLPAGQAGGWNLLVELDGANAVVNSFTWGLDLSGILQGAGGVGGLIAIKPAASAARFAAYDGNGNVVALIDGGSGQTDTHYEYGPFGETLRATGAMATANPFRFSTKYTDGETDLLYYGHRYCNPGTGRWVSRDPIEEKGGVNLYVFVGNSAANHFDPLGLTIPGTGPGAYPPYKLPLPPDPNKLEGFAICQRDINEEKVTDRCVNKFGGYHRFAKHYDKTTRWGYGFSQAGVHPEKTFNADRCSPCTPTSSALQHGTTGKGKTGTQATVEEIKDCIANHPASQDYLFLWYDCRHWAADAAKACGLSCQ